MTFTQIMALLSLLAAFGVDTPTIDRVSAILKTAPITHSQTIMDTKNEPVVPEVENPVKEPEATPEVAPKEDAVAPITGHGRPTYSDTPPVSR